MEKKKTVFVNPYMERLELNGTTSQGKVEPLQNGEREELLKIKEKLKRRLPIGAFTGLYEEVTDNREDRVLGYITCAERVLDDYAKVVLDLLSQSKKEGDIASDFLYWHPIGGGFPDQSIKIGVAFEPCSGCHEDFGFIIEKDGKRISAGISLKDAISKARMELESLTNQKKDI